LYVRNDNLYAQPLNVDARRLDGDADLIATSVRSLPGIYSYASYFAVSRSGMLAWRPGQAERAQVTMFDRRSQRMTMVGTPGAFDSLFLSPDETRILVHLPPRPVADELADDRKTS